MTPRFISPAQTSVPTPTFIYPPTQAAAFLKPNMPRPIPWFSPSLWPSCSPCGSSIPCFAQGEHLRDVFVSSLSLISYLLQPLYKQVLSVLPSKVCEESHHFLSPSQSLLTWIITLASIWSSCFPFAPRQSVPVTPLLSSFQGFHIPEAKPESLSCPCPERLYTSVVAASLPATLLSSQASHTSLVAVPLARQALLCHSAAPGLAGTRIPLETCSICCCTSFRALPHVSLWRETCSDLTGWNRPHPRPVSRLLIPLYFLPSIYHHLLCCVIDLFEVWLPH